MFNVKLSLTEQWVLDCFKDHDPIAYPADCPSATKQQLAEAIKSLQQKQLIKQQRPLSLTRSGRRYLKSQITVPKLNNECNAVED